MASILPGILTHDRGDGPAPQRVPPAQRRDALSVLLTGSTGGDAAVDNFVRFAQEHGLDLSELWAAMERGRPVAAALLVPSAGRTAMVFLSPVTGRNAVPGHATLVAAACGAQDPAAVRLIQALLEPQQALERRALEAAGFSSLATLIYMQRAVEATRWAAPEDLGRGLRALRWDESHRAVFAAAILASYEDTLDCPGLLGTRAIDDVIDGHMGTGRFDPSLWRVFLEGDRPVGVMLLSEVPQRRALELVYLGVAKPWRGQGLARRMMDLGLSTAAERGATAMVLAVDEQNTPALTLYRHLAFRPTARKVAVILTRP